jgi:4-hydroxyphenylpyruvate dioxygenase-like putative hemolysin
MNGLPAAYEEATGAWRERSRTGNGDALFPELFTLADRLVRQLGPDMAAHVVCRCERDYWLTRNAAGRLQRDRQAAMGLGLANHDHHTFRSSRRNFHRLVSLFARLGFRNRERFYAGAEAGWGAQVMENPGAGITLFLDVDLAPEEVETDFSREELGEREQLGTVGLWCALHGDSLFAAGMHHLAAQFDFERLIADLGREGVAYMAPFSDFSYLKQAFSVAERWEVEPARVERLVRDRAITAEQGERIIARGAVGSHLEDIDRREGYKGFNRKNVSAIIRETDPRRHMV